MKGALIFVGVLFIIAAIVFLVIGQVWVAKGEKGTWDIWPMYLIHGITAFLGLACFYVANTTYKGAEGEAPGEGVES